MLIKNCEGCPCHESDGERPRHICRLAGGKRLDAGLDAPEEPPEWCPLRARTITLELEGGEK